MTTPDNPIVETLTGVGDPTPTQVPPPVTLAPLPPPKPPCHTGNVPVFTTEFFTLFGGGNSNGAVYTPRVIIDLADNVMRPVDVEGIGFNNVRAFLPTIVKVAWKDHGVPVYGRSFWDALVTDMVAYGQQHGPTDMLVVCQGGHGRTGTALAILACLFGAVPEGLCPVAWVREHYCQEAVESTEQLKYIEKVTGRKVTSGITPAYTYTPTGHGTQYESGYGVRGMPMYDGYDGF